MRTTLHFVAALVGLLAIPAEAALNEPSAAFTAAYKQCSEGNAQACMTVGNRFKSGEGAPLNPAGAMRSFKRACDLGLARACALTADSDKAPDAPNAGESKLISTPLLVQRETWYWLEYNNSKVMEAILNGDPKARSAPDFKAIYYYYQGRYSANCPQLIPQDAPGYVYETVTTPPSGPAVTTRDGKIRVRAEYFEKFKAYGSDIARGLRNATTSNQSLKDMITTASNATTYIGNVKQDLDALFTDNGCSSGLQQQFSENLRRLAYGEPTLQQDGKATVNYAAQDTSAGSIKKSLTIACYEHYKARWQKHPYGDFWHENGKWCRCLDQRFKPMLSHSALEAAIGDFNAFETSVTRYPTDANDPAWGRVRVADSCKNR